MASDWYWKRHDTAPPIQGQLTYLSTGQPPDLTGATVQFVMTAKSGTTPKVNAAATVVSALSGTVQYPPIAADTDTAGDFVAEFQVTFPDGSVETFPNPAYIAITITADLDNA